jgi:predicted nucleotidyltransferase
MQNTNKYGLNGRDMQILSDIFDKYEDVKTVLLFGSRAKGLHHPGSDIDMAIVDKNIPHLLLRKIKSDISDSSLPYNVDLVNYSTLTNPALKEHISRVGKVLYSATLSRPK